MYKLNYFRILMYSFLISRAHSELKFNNLQDKLILNLFKVKPKTNLVGSALLVRFPLCKLASVATGEAKQELMTILGYKDATSLSNCYSRVREPIRKMAEADLTYANGIYLNYSSDVDPMFITNSTEKYGVQVDKVGFNYPRAAVTYINHMISALTFQRISDVLDSRDVDKTTTMVIVSCAHFKGTWEFPFDFRLTKLMNFRHIDGKISKIPMMVRSDDYPYVAAADCEVLTIKFGSWRSSITFVLPYNPQDLPKLLQRLEDEPNYLNGLIKLMQIRPKKVILPRLKIKNFVDWTGFLKELGLYSVFNSNSTDLEGIFKNDKNATITNNIYLSKIKQKLFIQIDEMGVARFARDPSDYSTPRIPPFAELPKFTADRPFYFQITYDFENARYEMFSGVYYGPEPTTPVKVA